MNNGTKHAAGLASGTPFVLQIVGYKNSGKTTLVCSLVERLKVKGYRVAVIKHDAHDFEMDHAGTDTYRHRAAGASAIALVSARQTAVIRSEELSLQKLIHDFDAYDIVLVEGFKHESYSKLVMVRRDGDRELIHLLENVKGVVTWMAAEDELSAAGQEKASGLAVFGKDEIAAVIDWLEQQL